MSTRPSLELLRAACALALAAFGLTASGKDALDLRAEQEHQRDAKERQRIETAYNARVHECEAQFIVTSCVEQAKADRRQAIDRLTQQQAVIDDALRKQRVAERLERLQEKQQLAADRRNAPPAPPRVVNRKPTGVASAPGTGTAASGPATPASAAHLPALMPKPDAAERQRNRQTYQQRQQSAAAHREAVERRNAERAASRKPAPSLPVPQPASAASR